MNSREFGTIATYNGTFCFFGRTARTRTFLLMRASFRARFTEVTGVAMTWVPDIDKPGKMRAVGVQFIDLRGSSVR
jgi:hypothetical protein